MKGKSLINKYKNKRIRVFVNKSGDVFIETKRLRESPREPVIVWSKVAYKDDTFRSIVQMWLQLQCGEKGGCVHLDPIGEKSGE